MKTWTAGAVCLLVGCTHRDPPAPLGDPTASSTFASAAPVVTGPALRNTSSATGSAAAPPSVAPTAASAAAGDGEEQTKDMPSAESPAFRARMALLFKALQANDATIAKDAFFPVAAYERVKAVANARGDHERRLFAAFTRDIAAIHRKHGDKWTDAKFVGVDVPMEKARWVMPGEEGNKLGYFRVYHSHISYEIDGVTHRSEIVSLISWRGEWFVVHLSGFK